MANDESTNARIITSPITTMNGQILSAPSIVRVPYSGSRTIHVIAECNSNLVPADSFAYMWENWGQNIGEYNALGNGTALATITLTNDNETGSAITLSELLYSFWNGNIADDNRPITIIYEPERKRLMV